MRKKNLVTALLVASMLVGSVGVTSTPAEAKSKIKLSSKSILLNGGASKTITLKGTKKKVKWTIVSGKKNIKLKNKKKTSVKIVGVKRGTAKVQAKLGKKKYICRVTVRKSTPAKTITVTTADTQTAKAVHEAFNTGNAVNLKVKGSKSSASKLMKQLASKVGEYNKFDVVPQYVGGYNADYTSSVESADSGYRLFQFDSYDSQLYKYGLLLVKDIINTFKQNAVINEAKKNENVRNTEDFVRKDYVVGTDNYKTTFTEVTGIPYDSTVVVNGSPSYSASLNYPDGQIAKSKSLNLEEKQSYNLPSNWDYMSWEHNGETRKYSSNEDVYLKRCGATKGDFENYRIFNPWIVGYELKLSDVTFHYVESETGVDVYSPKIYIKPDEEDKYYDLPQDWYYLTYKDDTGKIQYYTDDTYFVLSQEEADDEDYANYTLNFDWEGYDSHMEATKKVKFSDVTFHYEPLTVDTAPVDQAIEKKIRARVEQSSGYGADSYVARKKRPYETTEFYKFSQAEQQYYVSRAFHHTTTWCGYDKKSYSGDGLRGIKAMLKHGWWGKCSGYAAMEETMYRLFGISDYMTIDCKECNHAWTAVRVTNARGERAWLTNDYAMSEIGLDKPFRHYHDGKKHPKKVYENFVFAK